MKRYVREPGERALAGMLERYECVSSALLRVEMATAVHRRVREETLLAADAARLLEALAEDRTRWTLVEIGDKVLATAETIAAAHPVRALDAVHLASASVFAAKLAANVLFVSADRQQAAAAAAMGFTVRVLP